MPVATSTGAPLLAVSDEEFGLFRELIHRHIGIFLKEGKRPLLASRLSKRLRQLGLETLTQYYHLLVRGDPEGEELERMVNCITTNKTSFFREENHFRYLRDWLADKARASQARSGVRRLRIWSAACSSGEEPYSIAISALEALAGRSGWDVSILASDIDTEMLGRAEAGIYGAEDLEGLDVALKRRYFLRGKGEYEGLVQVKPGLRRLVVFRRINLIEESWSVQPGFDAIFCRNVVIYFERSTQRRLFERLLRHLAPDGRLFVGHSESLYWLNELVTPVQHTVYRLRSAGTPP